MENASKALLIAGAVLICIVLISIGMLIVNSSQDVTSQVDDITKTQSVTSFNSTYSNYQGTQKGAAVKTLFQSVSANNSQNTSEHTVTIVLDGRTITKASDITAAAADIVSSATYKIVMSGIDGDGYINEITIQKTGNKK